MHMDSPAYQSQEGPGQINYYARRLEEFAREADFSYRQQFLNDLGHGIGFRAHIEKSQGANHFAANYEIVYCVIQDATYIHRHEKEGLRINDVCWLEELNKKAKALDTRIRRLLPFRPFVFAEQGTKVTRKRGSHLSGPQASLSP